MNATVDPDHLERALRRTFGGSREEARTVARQAVDLADSGRYEADVGVPVTDDVVLEELADAPDGTPADRWNWWIGSLDLAFGGYAEFTVRRFPRE